MTKSAARIRRLTRTLEAAYQTLGGHHEMYGCDWTTDIPPKTRGPCHGCNVLRRIDRTLKAK